MLDRLVEVDYDWTGASQLAQIIADVDIYNFAIASYVIEHVPNMLGWLRGIENVLRIEGRFNPEIPDRRFTFDVCCPEARWGNSSKRIFTNTSVQVFVKCSIIAAMPRRWIRDRYG